MHVYDPSVGVGKSPSGPAPDVAAGQARSRRRGAGGSAPLREPRGRRHTVVRHWCSYIPSSHHHRERFIATSFSPARASGSPGEQEQEQEEQRDVMEQRATLTLLADRFAGLRCVDAPHRADLYCCVVWAVSSFLPSFLLFCWTACQVHDSHPSTVINPPPNRSTTPACPIAILAKHSVAPARPDRPRTGSGCCGRTGAGSATTPRS